MTISRRQLFAAAAAAVMTTRKPTLQERLLASIKRTFPGIENEVAGQTKLGGLEDLGIKGTRRRA